MASIPDITFEDIVNKTKTMLGKNYKEEISKLEGGDTDTPISITELEDVCNMVVRETAQWTNRFTEEQIQDMLNDCWPIIVKCSCVAYLNRGAEGLGSQSELGQQNVYNDWVTLLHKQIMNRRYVM